MHPRELKINGFNLKLPIIWLGHDIKQSEKLCERLIRHNIEGAFFAPLVVNNENINTKIANKLNEAGISVVLLDRSIYYPGKSKFDVVSMDNINAGYIATKHLLSLGCRKIHFLTHTKPASTAKERIAGYQMALNEENITPNTILTVSPYNKSDVQNIYNQHKPEALVVIDDESAKHIIDALLEIDVQIPKNLRIVSFDDLYYSKDLPVPLTTIRQPVYEIGVAAVNLMTERIENKKMSPRKLLIAGQLIVRDSSGANL